MYEVLNYSLKEIALNYIVFFTASLLIYPLVNVIITAVKGGANRWR